MHSVKHQNSSNKTIPI